MLERGHEVGLALEALRELAVDGDGGLERLDRHGATQGLLNGLVDDGHAATADLAEDSTVPDLVHHGSRANLTRRARFSVKTTLRNFSRLAG